MKILQRDSLVRGGFAGLKETQLIHDERMGGDDTTWNGIGNFIYLADARYLPEGETHMHSHHEVDVITVMLEGCLNHQGSLEDGQSMKAGQVQVQRAGGDGFSHNEVNPNMTRNRLLQLWAKPETPGEASAYKFYDLEKNNLTRIYGGGKLQTQTFDSHTVIEVGLLEKTFTVTKTGEFLAYISNGEAELNGQLVKDGDLIKGDNINLIVNSDDLHLTLVTIEKE